jgi:hypothetical protein
VINLLTLAGAALAVVGLILLLAGLAGAARAMVRRRAYRKKPLVVEGQGIWSGAMTASEVYVPGTIVHKLTVALAGVVVAALGAPLLWSGILLGSFTLVEPPRMLAVIRIEGDRLLVTHSTGEIARGSRPAPVMVAHAEFIEFGGPLARLGLGNHARLTHLAGYRNAGDVLSRRPTGGFDVAGRKSLHGVMERVEKWLPGYVQATRRFSAPMPDGVTEVTLWGTSDGLVWR